MLHQDPNSERAKASQDVEVLSGLRSHHNLAEGRRNRADIRQQCHGLPDTRSPCARQRAQGFLSP